MTKIKLCGVKRMEDVELANALKPDYVAFIFIHGSHRYVDTKTAAAFKQALDPSIPVVGVFASERPMIITNLLRMGVIDAVQFNGYEGEEEMLSLRRQFDAPIFKTISVDTPTEVLSADHNIADYIQFDTGKEDAVRAFRWRLTKFSRRGFFLAGGLTPENVTEALEFCHPYGLDASLGVETDGCIDPEKTKEFFRKVREADAK